MIPDCKISRDGRRYLLVSLVVISVCFGVACRNQQYDSVERAGANSVEGFGKGSFGFSELHLAVIEHDIEQVESLLLAGVNPDVETSSNPSDQDSKAPDRRVGQTPLHFAASLNHLGIVEMLIDHGATVDATTSLGYTPMHAAASSGNWKVVEILLRHGARINVAAAEKGLTPLHMASEHGREYTGTQLGRMETVETLINNGAKVDALDKSGLTPLHRAVGSGSVETATVLLDNGADSSILTPQGFSAKDISLIQNYSKTMKALFLFK